MTDEAHTTARICRLFAEWRGRQPGIPDAHLLAHANAITDPRMDEYMRWFLSNTDGFVFDSADTAGDSAHLPIAGQPVNNAGGGGPQQLHARNLK